MNSPHPQRLRKEMNIWAAVEHRNILPFFGFCRFMGNQTPPSVYSICFVSPWMANGDIISFLRRNPHHDRLRSVGSLYAQGSQYANTYKICEISAGLEYLHSVEVVHGDIKGVSPLGFDLKNTPRTSKLTSVLGTGEHPR